MTAWRFLSLSVLVGALVPGVALADSRSAGDVEAARAHYKRGVELYEAGKYEPALAELERANSLAPTYRLLYNMALVQRQLGDAAGALRSFRSYLDAGASVPAARRTEVESAIAELTAKVATVTITANVPDTAITDDDRAVGTTPLAAPLPLNPGPHRLVASKAGYRTVTRAVDLVAGERLDLPFTLEEVAPPAPPVPEAPRAPAPASPAVEAPPPVIAPPPAAPVPLPIAPAPAPAAERPPPTWIGWTVTGALAAGAVGTGIAALVSSHTLSTDIADHATSAATIQSAHASTVTLALVSDILTGSAVAAAGVTLYLKVTSKPRVAPAGASAGVHVGPTSIWFSAVF